MNAVDMNVLVRLITRDDKEQARLVYERLKEAEKANAPLFVSLVVLLDTTSGEKPSLMP